MARGGRREGAGRKPLKERPARQRVRAASEYIDESQPEAAGTLVKALKATMRVHRIIGQDKAGKPIYGYEDVPDHTVRIRAAQIILNKRIPDVARQEFTNPEGNPLPLGVILYPEKKKEGEL